jgi:ribosomal protein S12 methylthiotransferase
MKVEQQGELYPLDKKIGIVSLGCPKNLVDSEIMLGQLRDEGYEIVQDSNDAQIIIVNTCGFIDSAKQESINTIIEMAALKEKNCERLIVAGCLAQRYRDMILDELPEVDAVMGTGSYGDVASVIKEAYSRKHFSTYCDLRNTSYLDCERVISTGNGYAYLKVAEGCNNCCTYCVIPSLRGPFRSRKIDSIINEAKRIAALGIKEIILVAQDTTRYGTDNYANRMLVQLLRELSKIDGIQWIRLLYCYPEEIDDELIAEIAQNDKVCKYLDIPIQHASDAILKAMGRRGKSNEIGSLLQKLRSTIPDIVIRTTVIVGFPGETEDDFQILSEFIDKYRFDRLGVFMYSKEEGTPASNMLNQVPARLKRSRYEKLMRIQRKISAELNSERLGRTYRVLVEGVSEDGIFYYGRSYAESPDIDGLLYFTSSEPLEGNQFVNVKILDCDDYDLTGEVKYESSE